MERFPRWTKSVLNLAHSLISPSRYLADGIGKFGYKITEIANSIDLSQYAFRERRDIQPRLIWMRSFHAIYNPEMAVRVLSQLRTTYPTATLTMAGVDKGMEIAMRQLVSDLELTDSVTFPGFLDCDGKAREFMTADVYLNTNRIDNMPVSVIEACAFGLPVVATSVGGVPYLIDHGNNGMLVPDNDVTAMTETIRQLLADPNLTRRISLGARKLAERSSWDRLRIEWEKLLTNVLNSNFLVDNNSVQVGVSTENVKVRKIQQSMNLETE
jgi:glycosyltransferase involved in cell wall biosynthesis